MPFVGNIFTNKMCPLATYYLAISFSSKPYVLDLVRGLWLVTWWIEPLF